METDERIAFLRWLEDRTVTELREAGSDVEKQKQAFMKPRLETPLLAAGRKAGTPKAGNQ
jgi:hypothetical protein